MQPTGAAVRRVQPATVSLSLNARLGALAIAARSLVPSSARPPPIRPGPQVAPFRSSALLPLPEASNAVVPWPSEKGSDTASVDGCGQASLNVAVWSRPAPGP